MKQILALHGFLGKPSDWNEFDIEFIGIDLDQFASETLDEWAFKFNAFVKKEFSNPILMGYSLGGRLALHAMIQEPALWKAGIIISANPGLSSEIEKEKRVENDLAWAKRFQQEDWNTLMNSWENQNVFKGSVSLKRNEKDYDRKKLANWLINYSLGKQKNLLSMIRELPMPILWMAGECDRGFCDIAKSVELKNPHSNVRIMPGAGHRLPWDQPTQFTDILRRFVASC